MGGQKYPSIIHANANLQVKSIVFLCVCVCIHDAPRGEQVESNRYRFFCVVGRPSWSRWFLAPKAFCLMLISVSMPCPSSVVVTPSCVLLQCVPPSCLASLLAILLAKAVTVRPSDACECSRSGRIVCQAKEVSLSARDMAHWKWMPAESKECQLTYSS